MRSPFNRLGARKAVPDDSATTRPAAAGGVAGWKTRLAALKARGQSTVPWLLLTWDVAGMEAVVWQDGPDQAKVLARARSSEGRFPAALAEIMQALAGRGFTRLRRVGLAARHLLPAVVDLPVAPDKPRRPEQMRELIQADLEPVLAEFGSVWSMGALMQARGYLSAADRERIGMEESVRRQSRHNQLRYGEIAIDLGLLSREELDECLDQQAALQNLDAAFMAGWRGRIEDKQPLWLACGVGNGAYREWKESLAGHGLRLAATLPLAWLVSDPTPEAAGASEPRREQNLPLISLELHHEEVVAVCRRQGRVVAARSEARIERTPGADWLNRIIGDWAAEPRARIEIFFLHEADDPLGETLCDALSLTTGHPCVAYPAEISRVRLWQNLLREASALESQLPRLAEAELRGSLWTSAGFRRGLALGLIVLGLAGVESVQRYRLHAMEARISERQEQEKQRQQSSQQEAQVNEQLNTLARQLDEARRQLEPLLNDRLRLNRIMAMRTDLPNLLYLLAQSVGSDAVLEEIRNDNTRGEGSAIQVVAWSPNYTGAQDFVSRIAALAHGRSYGVSQTEIKERRGRNGKPGHQVSFWLLPEEHELEESEPLAKAPAAPATPLPAGAGISSQAPGVPTGPAR